MSRYFNFSNVYMELHILDALRDVIPPRFQKSGNAIRQSCSYRPIDKEVHQRKSASSIERNDTISTLS